MSATHQHRPDRRAVLASTVTPLASIFGSGFLILVPTLERGLGGAALPGIGMVLVLAWFVGAAIRRNIGRVEAARDAGELPVAVRRLERGSDAVIIVAYVISVTLYLRILAQYATTYAGVEGETVQRLLATVLIVGICAIGVLRGFRGLDRLDRVALGATLLIIVALLGAFIVNDLQLATGGDLVVPPVPADRSLLDIALTLGGIVITVQGFETVRFLGDEFDRPTRIAASRVAQLVAAGVYVVFVAAATPLMGIVDGSPDGTLLQLTERVAALFALPLVIIAILSQLSAAIADTVASVGNLNIFHVGTRFGKAVPYVVTAVAAAGLAWVIELAQLVAVASRAFAGYYALQAVVAARMADRRVTKVLFGLLAVLMLGITVFAKPAG